MAHQKDYNQAVKLYNSGLSIGAVATMYGISRQAMHDILKRRGVVFRSNLRYGQDNHFYRGTRAIDGAQNQLEKKVSKGAITPKPCEVCGEFGWFKDGRVNVQAHHSDYSKPLDVTWLCQQCHHEWHKHNKAKGAINIEVSESVFGSGRGRSGDATSAGIPVRRIR